MIEDLEGFHVKQDGDVWRLMFGKQIIEEVRGPQKPMTGPDFLDPRDKKKIISWVPRDGIVCGHGSNYFRIDVEPTN